MRMPAQKLILITGMSGSGKTTLADMFRDDGYRIVTMGDVIRGVAEERGVEPTPEALGSIAKEIRREGGDAAVADKCVEMLGRMDDPVVVVDGVRSLSEVDAFRESFDTSLVAIHASPGERYRRLKERGRSDDPDEFSPFRERDLRELGFSLGWAVALADYMIVNEGTLEELGDKYRSLIGRLAKG